MRGAASQCEGHETMVDRQRIEGWKAIAAHFDRGVRTVQRWERELGMPVRRRGTGRGEVVFAFSDELNAWWTGSESASEAPDQGALPHVAGADAEAPHTVDLDAAADGLEPRRGLAARWRRWALSSRSRATLLAAIGLTLFIPLIISSGGNSGSQSATLITRALAVARRSACGRDRPRGKDRDGDRAARQRRSSRPFKTPSTSSTLRKWNRDPRSFP